MVKVLQLLIKSQFFSDTCHVGNWERCEATEGYYNDNEINQSGHHKNMLIVKSKNISTGLYHKWLGWQYFSCSVLTVQVITRIKYL